MRPVTKVPVPVAGSRICTLSSAKAAPEVLLQQVVRAPDDEVHHLVGSVDHPQAVGGGGVVGLVEVLVNGLEELLLLRVLGDFVGGAADGPVVGAEAVDGLAAHVAGEEGLLQGRQLPGDVVLPVELVLGEHPEEDVLGEDVLEQHLPHIGLGHGGADAAVAQFKEPGDAFAVVGIAFLGLSHRLAEVLENGGQVGLELLLCLTELLDLRQFVAEEAGDEPVQVGGPGHVHPHGLFPVLDQDGGAGVLEDDVVLRVALGELLLNLGVQVVVGVLGLPVAAGHAQGVLDGAVGDAARAGQLRHQVSRSRWSLQ